MLRPGLRIRCFCMDPDPVFKFLWIRIQILEQKKIAERSLKVLYQFMTKDRQKMKKATISYEKSS